MVFLNVNIKKSGCVFGSYLVHKDTFDHFVQTVHHYHYIDEIISPKVTADGKIDYKIDRIWTHFLSGTGKSFETSGYLFLKFFFFSNHNFLKKRFTPFIIFGPIVTNS